MKKHKSKIVIITSSQPSLNPRMVKEADTLSDAGYDVTVIGQFWNSWAQEADQVLMASKKWKFIQVGGTPNHKKAIYLVTRFFHKLSRIVYSQFGNRWLFAEFAVGRCTLSLYREALRQKGDFYIGHNPGAMAPTVWVAKRLKRPCGLDAEDFHRNEYSEDPSHSHVKIAIRLEETYFKQADYLTAASPMIAERYETLFPNLTFHIINNVFPKVSISAPMPKLKKHLDLFWFSQTIGTNRGIDEVLQAMSTLHSHKLKLHLLGFKRQSSIDHYQSLAIKYGLTKDQLHFYDPIPADQIFSLAAQFDIGLATETGIPYNRQICLTNKIFTYLQSGLAILASDTLAQKRLLEKYPGMGLIFKNGDAESISNALKIYLDNKDLLQKYRYQAWHNGQTLLNWEKEGAYFLRIVQSVIFK